MKTLPVRRSLSLLACAAIVAATACARQSALPAANALAAPGAGPAVRAARPHARRGTLPSQLLFVPNEDGTIGIYPLKHASQSGPVAEITGLAGSQQQMTVDKNGNLIVVNNGGSAQDDYVAEYAPPYDGSPVILNTSWQGNLFYPIGVAVDSQGTVYVTDCGTYCFESPGIYVYPSGATSPQSVITSPKFDSMAGLAVDAHDNLYALEWSDTSYSSDVYKIAAGAKTPKPLRLHGLSIGDAGNGLTFDAAGDLFVGNGNSGSNYILGFRPGAHNPYKIIDSMPFGMQPEMLTFGPDGNLYVPVGCPFTPCVQMYAFHAHAGKAFESIGSSQSSATFTLGVATAPNLQLEGK